MVLFVLPVLRQVSTRIIPIPVDMLNITAPVALPKVNRTSFQFLPLSVGGDKVVRLNRMTVREDGRLQIDCPSKVRPHWVIKNVYQFVGDNNSEYNHTKRRAKRSNETGFEGKYIFEKCTHNGTDIYKLIVRRVSLMHEGVYTCIRSRTNERVTEVKVTINPDNLDVSTYSVTAVGNTATVLDVYFSGITNKLRGCWHTPVNNTDVSNYINDDVRFHKTVVSDRYTKIIMSNLRSSDSGWYVCIDHHYAKYWNFVQVV